MCYSKAKIEKSEEQVFSRSVKRINGEYMNAVDMTQESMWKVIVKFSIPLMLGNICQQLYLFIDALIVGRRLGVNGLAALGSIEWYVFLVFGFIQGITQGFSVCISQSSRMRQKELLRQSIYNALVLSLAIGFLLQVICLNTLSSVLDIMRVPYAINVLAKSYLQILYASIPIFFFNNMLLAILRALGNGALSFIAVLLSSFGNIFLDIFFLYILEFGIGGAAYGTVLAQFMSLIFCWSMIKRTGVKISSKDKKIDKKILINQLAVGLPIGLQNVITSVGGLAIQYVINGFDILFIAGYIAANKIYILLEIAASSYGYTILTYTAQNKGINKNRRILQGFFSILSIGVITAVMMSFIMIVFGQNILSFFSNTSKETLEETIRYGYDYLIILAFFFPMLYFLYICRSCLQGIGNTIIPMLSSVIQSVMRIFFAYLICPVIGYKGIFWGEVWAWIGADIFLGIAFIIQYKKIT